MTIFVHTNRETMNIRGLENVELLEVDGTTASIIIDVDASLFMEDTLEESVPGDPQTRLEKFTIEEQLAELPTELIEELIINYIKSKI